VVNYDIYIVICSMLVGPFVQVLFLNSGGFPLNERFTKEVGTAKVQINFISMVPYICLKIDVFERKKKASLQQSVH